MKMTLLPGLISLCCLLPTLGLPRSGHHHKHSKHHGKQLQSRSQVQTPAPLEYLVQFGYLPQFELGGQLSEEQMSNAIRNLQFMAGLNITGEVDRPTSELLIRPR